MCIHYRTTFTNKRIIWNKPDTNIFTHFKCGQCFECLKEISDNLNFRAYYQAKDTFNKGGYTIFDTLTYSEKFIPHINDVLGLNLKNNYYCFRHSDIVNFLKNLRIKLTRKYNETNTLATLYTGEYGTNNNCTHRPHIHIIFYYTGKCNPEDLSNLISDTWKFGRTDGIKYKGKNYFFKKRLFTTQNNYNLNQVRYICKYLQKESSYDYEIKKRCYKIIKELNLSGQLSYNDKLNIRKNINVIRQFRRISSNFGIEALNHLDLKILDNGNKLVNIPDTTFGIKSLILPTYYIRKLYQNLVYYNIGNEVFSRWVWNQRGIVFKENNKLFNINNIKKHITSLEESRFSKYTNLYLYEYNKGTLTNNNFTSLINYNTPKYKDLLNNNIILTKEPIIFDDENSKIIISNELSFNDLNYIYDEELEKYLNSLKNNRATINKERHRHYLKLKELENKLKYLGLK